MRGAAGTAHVPGRPAPRTARPPSRLSGTASDDGGTPPEGGGRAQDTDPHGANGAYEAAAPPPVPPPASSPSSGRPRLAPGGAVGSKSGSSRGLFAAGLAMAAMRPRRPARPQGGSHRSQSRTHDDFTTRRAAARFTPSPATTAHHVVHRRDDRVRHVGNAVDCGFGGQSGHLGLRQRRQVKVGPRAQRWGRSGTARAHAAASRTRPPRNPPPPPLHPTVTPLQRRGRVQGAAPAAGRSQPQGERRRGGGGAGGGLCVGLRRRQVPASLCACRPASPNRAAAAHE
jgi:hypothetical protein